MAHGRKTGGRRKGTPNRITGDMRQALETLVRSEVAHIIDVVHTLDAKDRLAFLTKILPYVLPRFETIAFKSSSEIEDSSWFDFIFAHIRKSGDSGSHNELDSPIPQKKT